MLRLSNQAQIDRLKKLAQDGTATEQDLARLSLLIESVGDSFDEIQAQTEGVCLFTLHSNTFFKFLETNFISNVQ